MPTKKSKIDLANAAIEKYNLELPEVDSASPEEYVDAILLIKKNIVNTEPHNKYKIFRNYMTNELKITQDDVKEWTLQAVKEQTQKILNSLNIQDIMESYIKNTIKNIFEDYHKTEKILTEALHKEIEKKLSISVSLRKDD